MRRALIGSLCFLILAGATYSGAITGCGGSSGGGDTPTPTARNVTGTIASSVSANIASMAKAAATDDCSGITSVVAVASDGTSVTDDTLESCAFTLELTIGTAYMFEFRNPNKKSKSFANGLTIEASSAILYPSATQQFTALKDGVQTTDVTWKLVDGDVDGVLETSAGSKFTIEDGSDEIPLGTITISNGSANFNSDLVCNNPGNAKYILCEDWTETTPDELTGYGSIDANGLFTAPSDVPEKNHVTIIASLVADETQDGTADMFLVKQLTFSLPRNITSEVNATHGFWGSIDIDTTSDYIVSAFDQYIGENDTTIDAAKSADGGDSFAAAVSTGVANNNKNPVLYATADGTVFLAFSNYSVVGGTSSNNDYYLTKTADGGATLSTPVKINGGDSKAPAGWTHDLVVDNTGVIHFVWAYEEGASGAGPVYYTRSTDGGTSFETPKSLYSTGTGWNEGGSGPSITADANGNVYVLWSVGVAAHVSDIYLAVSTDNGVSFGSPVRVNTSAGGAYHHGLYRNALVVDSEGRVLVVWGKYRGDVSSQSSDLYVSISTDGGATFAIENLVSDRTGFIGDRRIKIDSNGIYYVSWASFLQPSGSSWSGFFFSRSGDGITWTDVQALYDTLPNNNEMYIGMSVPSNDLVHVLWRTATVLNYQRGE